MTSNNCMDLTRTRAEACERMSEKAFVKLVYATMRYMVFIIMNKVEKFASSAFSYLVFVHNQSDSFSLALFLLIIRFSIPFQLQPNDQLWFLSSLSLFLCVSLWWFQISSVTMKSYQHVWTYIMFNEFHRAFYTKF